MGAELGECFYEIWQEVARLHSKWAEYKYLYGDSEERIALLNTSASSFFKIVQDMFWESTMVQLCRLTDPPKSYGKRNLTVQLFSDLVEDAIKSETDILVVEAKQSTKFCRDWRNRRIAHRDLSLYTDEACDPLEKASVRKVNEAMLAIVKVINKLEDHYENKSTYFDTGNPIAGATSLIYILENDARSN